MQHNEVRPVDSSAGDESCDSSIPPVRGSLVRSLGMRKPGTSTSRAPAAAAGESGQPRRRRWLSVVLAVLLVGGVDVSMHSTPAAAATVSYNGAVGAPRIGMIGDSVMAAIRWGGTWAPLQRFNYTYDAESCRRTVGTSCRGREGFAPDNTVQAMRRLRGQLGDVVFIGTGYDDAGSTFSSAVDAVMAEAAAQGIRTVVWLTMRTADVTYVGPTYYSNSNTFRDNNRILLAKQTQFGGRLRIADWATYSASRPDWVLSDGVHLSGSGSWAFAQYITDQAALALRTMDAPAAPAVTATVLGPTQVRLNWNAPAFAGKSPVLEYGFQRSSTTDPTWRSGMAGGASARSIVLGGLEPNTTYRFHMAARNASGWSAFSNVVTVTTRVVPPWTPGFNVSVLSPTSVRLHWLPPAITGGAPILEYGFQRSSSSDPRWRSGPAGGPSSRSRDLGGLVAGETYRFRIAARNSAGWSVMSGIITVTMRVAPPSAPSVTATATGPGQVRLDWTPGSSGGAPIVEYGFQRWAANDPIWRSGPSGGGSARSRSFSGLTPGVTYQFRVAARNSGGWSPMSAAATVTVAGESMMLTSSAEVSALDAEPVTESTEVEVTDSTYVDVTESTAIEVTESTDVEVDEVEATVPGESGGVSGVVFADADGDGVRDESDPRIGGVTVRVVSRTTGVIVAETLTGNDGGYSFDSIDAHPIIEVVLPDGTQPTRLDAGADDTVDSDADPVAVVRGGAESTVRIDIAGKDDPDHVDLGLVPLPDPAATTTTSTDEVPTTTAPASSTTSAPPTTTSAPPVTTSPQVPTTVVVPATTVAATTSAAPPETAGGDE